MADGRLVRSLIPSFPLSQFKLDSDSGHSVPVSQLPTLVYETKKDLEESGLIATMVGHVGDGTLRKYIAHIHSPLNSLTVHRQLPCPHAIR